MFLPTWVLIIVILIIMGLFLMVCQLFARLSKLRRLIRKLEDPNYEDRIGAGGDADR